MSKKDWVWMGRAAHFIAADSCHFRMATYIPASGVIVSTVGDYDPKVGDKRPAEIGFGRKYETFVFRGVKAPECDCPYHVDPPSELDTEAANDGKTAVANHYAMCEKWDDPAKRKEVARAMKERKEMFAEPA